MAKTGQICEDIYSELVADYQPEKALAIYSSIATKENGVHYCAKVRPKREAAVFQVDGCIIREGKKCDKLVLSVDPEIDGVWRGHFIELKGTNVNDAVQQLESTIKSPIFQHPTLVKRYARIVAVAFPANRADSNVERARNRFKKEYNCELKTIKSHQPDII